MINLLTNSIQALGELIVSGLDVLFSFIVQMFTLTIGLVIDLLFSTLTLLVSILPDMPELQSETIDFSPLSFANNYIPISDALLLLPVWGTVFASIGIYKLVKLIRG